MWYYQSEVGMMRIYENDTNGYILRICDTIIDKKYRNCTAAVIDVHNFVTGYTEWDSLRNTVQPPENISDWTYVRANF